MTTEVADEGLGESCGPAGCLHLDSTPLMVMGADGVLHRCNACGKMTVKRRQEKRGVHQYTESGDTIREACIAAHGFIERGR